MFFAERLSLFFVVEPESVSYVDQTPVFDTCITASFGFVGFPNGVQGHSPNLIEVYLCHTSHQIGHSGGLDNVEEKRSIGLRNGMKSLWPQWPLGVGSARCGGVQLQGRLDTVIFQYTNWPVLCSVFQIWSLILNFEDDAVSSELWLVG